MYFIHPILQNVLSCVTSISRVIFQEIYKTDPSGHLSPGLGMDDVRSKSWNTLLLAPAAFITTVYNPDRPDMEDPTTRQSSCVNINTPDYSIM